MVMLLLGVTTGYGSSLFICCVNKFLSRQGWWRFQPWCLECCQTCHGKVVEGYWHDCAVLCHGEEPVHVKVLLPQCSLDTRKCWCGVGCWEYVRGLRVFYSARASAKCTFWLCVRIIDDNFTISKCISATEIRTHHDAVINGRKISIGCGDSVQLRFRSKLGDRMRESFVDTVVSLFITSVKVSCYCLAIICSYNVCVDVFRYCHNKTSSVQEFLITTSKGTNVSGGGDSWRKNLGYLVVLY